MTNQLISGNRPDDQTTDTAVLIVGWREWLGLPELGIPAVKAKIDTGARTSALHVAELRDFFEQGQRRVSFVLHPLRRRPRVAIHCTADVLESRVVSDSGGHKERRWVIETVADLGGRQWPIEITLTNRETMLFRMLLGRTAMKNRFLVDPALSYQYGRKLARAYRKS